MICADDDFKVVLDACVLYPQTLRDLLLRLALEGLYVVRTCRQWFATLRRPPRSAVEICNYLSRNGMPRAAEPFFRLLH